MEIKRDQCMRTHPIAVDVEHVGAKRTVNALGKNDIIVFIAGPIIHCG